MKRTILLKQAIQTPLVYKGGVAGASVPATSTTAGDYYIITTNGTSQGENWVVGDVAIYEGSSGNWTKVSGFNVLTKVAMPANTAASGNVGEYAVDATKLAFYVNATGWVFFDGYQIA